MMLACEIATVVWPCRRRTLGSSSIPIRNMKRITPTCERICRNGETAAGST
jgi:hypothetical protein